MNKSSIYRYLGIFYFLFDIIIQGYWIFAIIGNEWINDYSMENDLLLWCLLQAIFGESKLLSWIALIVLLLLIISLLAFFISIILRKNSFFVIPLFLIAINMIVHIILFWDKPSAYVGLAYKIVGFIIYFCVVFHTYRNKPKGTIEAVIS